MLPLRGLTSLTLFLRLNINPHRKEEDAFRLNHQPLLRQSQRNPIFVALLQDYHKVMLNFAIIVGFTAELFFATYRVR